MTYWHKVGYRWFRGKMRSAEYVSREMKKIRQRRGPVNQPRCFRCHRFLARDEWQACPKCWEAFLRVETYDSYEERYIDEVLDDIDIAPYDLMVLARRVLEQCEALSNGAFSTKSVFLSNPTVAERKRSIRSGTTGATPDAK
jgi:hypothetical protein